MYACAEEFGDAPFNILSLSPEVSITNVEQIQYEFFCCAFNGITGDGDCGSPPGSGWIQMYLNFSAFPTLIMFYRETQTTACVAGSPVPPPGTGWILDTNDCSTLGTAKYVRPPAYGVPPSSEITVNSGSACTSYVPAAGEFLACEDEYLGINYCFWWHPTTLVNATYNHTRPLLQVVDEIAQFTCPTINGVISDFFDWNPAADTPGYSPGINYVTGLSNKLTGIHISQKSDIIDPNASQPATVGELTFNELMQMFAVTFNAFWFIEGTKLRIEHISAYQYNLTLDLTTGAYATMLYGKNIYEYLTERRPRVEKFKFMEAFNQDFVGKDIEYFVDCIVPTIGRPRGGNSAEQSLLRENQITYDAGRFTTDLKYIEDNPDDINKDGFVLICTVDDGAGNLSVDYEAGLLSGNLMQNGHLAWSNLHHAYHRHNRVLLSGNMNGTLTTFLSAQNTKQQKNVDIYGCCSFDLNGTDLVKTEIGFGEVDEYTENLFTNRVTLTLNY